MGSIENLSALLLNFLLPRRATDVFIESITVETFLKKAKRNNEKLGPDTVAPFKYKDRLVKTLIHEMKYRKNIRATEILAEATSQNLLEHLSEIMIFENFRNPILIPIPASKKREREYGFNQALLLSEKLSICLGTLTIESQVLFRTGNSQSQTSLKNREERIRNVRGCFEVKDRKKVKGKNIILVDDVITTGATMNEARNALMDAGARQILSVAVAH